jgi:hypothetical protein
MIIFIFTEDDEEEDEYEEVSVSRGGIAEAHELHSSTGASAVPPRLVAELIFCSSKVSYSFRLK